MLTPVEMQGRELKKGRGYQKKETDEFLAEIFKDYEAIYRENMELKDKVGILSDGLKYYKDLEKTLQKTLVIAEKTADETTRISEKKADSILLEAQGKATDIIREANHYFEKVQNSIKNLEKQYESYRIQCKGLAEANLELLNAPAFKVIFDEIQEPVLAMPALSLYSDAVKEDKETAVTEEKTEKEAINIKEALDRLTANEEKPEERKEEQVELPKKKVTKDLEEETKILDNELFDFLNLGDDE